MLIKYILIDQYIILVHWCKRTLVYWYISVVVYSYINIFVY